MPKILILVNFEFLIIEKFGILGPMVNFRFFCDHLVYVFPFWYVEPRKIWQLWSVLLRSLAFI
jgi:hypothetical protein